MQTVAQTVEFDKALRTLAAKARERYAGEAARIDRGLVLALNGAVTLHADGTASVQSAKDAEIVYTVNGHCDCPDAQRAPEGRCKHRWAKCLVKRAQAELLTLDLDPEVLAETQPQGFYATYTAPDGATVQGTAQYVTGRGWLFTPEDGGDLLYAAVEALVLGGNVQVLEAQRQMDRDLVRKVCLVHFGRRTK